jgi:hypothetical protein
MLLVAPSFATATPRVNAPTSAALAYMVLLPASVPLANVVIGLFTFNLRRFRLDFAPPGQPSLFVSRSVNA